MTYPDESVATFLSENFVCLRFNVAEAKPEMRELLHIAKPLWSPTLLFLDASRAELRRFTGYLPPKGFLAEMKFVLGLSAMLRADYERAHRLFREIADDKPPTHVAPEALYWVGSAKYRLGGGLAAVKPAWDELIRRFPGSVWALRADVFPADGDAAASS